METISLNKLLGTKVKKLYSGSELMFVYELSKYTMEILDSILELEDVQVIKELRKSEYFSYVYGKGLDLNYEPNDKELVDTSEISRKFFNSDLHGVVFEKQTDKEWVYNYNTDRTANLVLNRYNRSAGYVSLYAYMIVKFFAEGKPVPKLKLVNSSPKQEELEYVDILILKQFGNKFLQDKVDIEYSREVVTQPEWEAYVVYHRQLGYMTSESKTADKIKYITRNFEVGDVVLYYKTEKAIKSKTIRKLVCCYPAVITDINKTWMKLVYYPDIATKLTRRRELERAEELCGGEYQYSHEDYNRFSACELTLDYINLGVDLLLYLEDEFILSLEDGIDKFDQYLVDKNGIEGLYKLGTIDTVYAVFEDRGVEYNKEKFLATHFKKGKPIYDKVLGR